MQVGARNCLRFKIGMSDPNKAMRDPVAYRCNPTHHWRTGDKYKVRQFAAVCGRSAEQRSRRQLHLSPIHSTLLQLLCVITDRAGY